VDSLGDTGSAPKLCELRSAIEAANTDTAVDGCSAGSGTDEIGFEVNGTIVLSRDLPDIVENLFITGPGKDLLTIDGSATYRQFVYAPSSGNHIITNLTLTRGATSAFGGCIFSQATSLIIQNSVLSQCHSDSIGGALHANHSITIERSYFVNNTANNNGGAIIISGGTSEIKDSTFESNSALGGATAQGGAIAVSSNAELTVLRSTFYGNKANADGGAISLFGTESLTVTSSTIMGNQANADASGVDHGGGIYVTTGSLTLGNTIIAGNNALNPSLEPADISITITASVTSNGYNLIGVNDEAETDFPAGNPNPSDDYVGTIASPIDATLEVLGDYGGPTRTMQPEVDSPVIDQGECPGEFADQREFSNAVTGMRIIDLPPSNASDGCDIGSVEFFPEGIFADGFESGI